MKNVEEVIKELIIKLKPFYEDFKEYSTETYINSGDCFLFSILLKEISLKELNEEINIFAGPYHVFCKTKYLKIVDTYNKTPTNKPSITKEGLEILKIMFEEEADEAIELFYFGKQIKSYSDLLSYFRNNPESYLILKYILKLYSIGIPLELKVMEDYKPHSTFAERIKRVEKIINTLSK